MSDSLVELTDQGLYCPAGGFHIDPWKDVDRAVITHAHGDHARRGSRSYLAAEAGRGLLEARLGDVRLETRPYGEAVDINGVRVSFHPAGHVLGSAQVRIEYRGEVWVVSGDYKLADDPTCLPFEPVRCDTFITESTFALPIYRWERSGDIFHQINAWWRANRDAGRASIIFAYSLGKSQRILAGVDASIGPIITHAAVENLNRAYRATGVKLPETALVSETAKGKAFAGALVIAPPSAEGSAWQKRFEPASTAVASGWMQVRGARRRRSADRGFVLSDHADWPGLLEAVSLTGASRVLATHGSAGVLARWLREHGLDAGVIATRFGDEDDVAGGEAS
ncbi:ligase-associated DNA damage response exonuclease [Zavarzinella formosa]|uniref:ligase-associated DNA damage response exonuclease n=1 Tax=Zavarzinella formosa TaxID=360055 RepID=UPI0002DFE778|nr:ligase-associated DNA damage response exonuclease [Zavarzinella formosa]